MTEENENINNVPAEGLENPQPSVVNETAQADDLTFGSRLNLEALKASVEAVKQEISSVIVGQQKMIDQLLVAILANGHVLLEGVPGVAKTITAKLLSKTLSLHFSRI